MDDLKKIKRDYGEKLAHLCRDIFPTVLETPGVLYETLIKTFNPTRYLYDDLIKTNSIDKFRSIIESELPKENEEIEEIEFMNPKELLEKAGYTLYECKNENDIQKFRKYYYRGKNKKTPEYINGTIPVPYAGEELCTFSGNRLERNLVFFAIKKNVDEIKRENFENPERQDEYGTSVLSIQFARGSNNTLSIKNRYNHTVSNPDATFSNNLDNIIPGLTKAFEKEYNLSIVGARRKSSIPGYVLANDGKYYKYNNEIMNVYTCPDNIIIDNFTVHKYDKSRYIVTDLYIIDLQDKIISMYEKTGLWMDGFLHDFKHPYQYALNVARSGSQEDLWKLYTDNYIKSIKVETNKETKEKKVIINNDIILELSEKNEIKKYTNPHVTEVEPHYLMYASSIESVNLPNLEKTNYSFLSRAEQLKEINIPKCKVLGDHFLAWANSLEEINLPNVESIGQGFMEKNIGLKRLILPKCTSVRSDFLCNNTRLEKIEMPSLEVAVDFLQRNRDLKELDLPNLKHIGNYFLTENNILKKVNLPKLKIIRDYFLTYNINLKEINLPSVEEIGQEFLSHNVNLESITLPECRKIESGFLSNNEGLEDLDLPKVKEIYNEFLSYNKILKTLNLPECEKIGNEFLINNHWLYQLNIPKVKEIGHSFLYRNLILKKLDIDNCEKIGEYFLENNQSLEELNINNARSILGKDVNEHLVKYLILPQNKTVVINGLIDRKEIFKDEESESNKSK